MENKDIISNKESVVGIIHNHPWTGRADDLRFSEFFPLTTRKGYYDRDIINADENEKYSFYLYNAAGVLWVNRGSGDDPYQDPNRQDEILAIKLRWDPRARVNGKELGPYPVNQKWEWYHPGKK